MFKSLSVPAAETFVESNSNVSWDGWDILIFEQDRKGKRSGQFVKSGAFVNGRWGIQTRISVSDDGTWKVPARFTR